MSQVKLDLMWRVSLVVRQKCRGMWRSFFHNGKNRKGVGDGD